MKYMLWNDLEPGDVLQFTDEYLEFLGNKNDLYNIYKGRDIFIERILVREDRINVYCKNTHYSVFAINYNGGHYNNRDFKGVMFKLIGLGKEQ